MKNNSKHFYFNSERNNFEQQPKRKISTASENGLIGPKSGTTTPKHVYGKLSSSSTSSITSCTLSVLNGNETNSYMANQLNNYNAQMNGMQMTVNPFEETNRFRLEQSVLSPNLFHVANTSTPERDTNSLWNIDQRAILYPADIQTDESSLMAQYVYDYKISKQVIPAVEAFWTQNKIIIESPLACTTGSAFRTKFANSSHLAKNGKGNSVNSPFSSDMATNNNSHKKAQSVSGSTNVGSESKPASSAYKSRENLKNQVCQTMLSIPLDFDLSKVLELKNFFIADEQNESPKKELNNSIRKKLFDQEDLSSSTSTTTTTNTPGGSSQKLSNGASILISKIKSGNFDAQNTHGKISQLPKPEAFVSKTDTIKEDAKLRTLASSSSSATTDDWQDSFEFEDHQFASSPKCEKFSNIIYDIGDFGHDDDLHDSVFEQHHRTPPDLSPLLVEIKTIKPTMTPIKEMQTPVKIENSTEKISRSNEANNHKNHHNRFFHFEMTSKNTELVNSNSNGITTSGSGSATKKDKNPSSPNLSPIRQQEKSSNLTLHGLDSGSVKAKKKIVHSSNKETSPNTDDMNVSSSFAKSVIFMDIGDNELNSSGIGLALNELQDCSFSEEIIGYDHHNHYKREEFYKRVSLGDDHIETENLRKEAELEKHSKMATNSNDNFSINIQNEESKDIKNLGYNLESTKSESESNFRHLLRNQIVEGDSSTNMEQYIPKNSIIQNSNNTNNNNFSKHVEQNTFNSSKPLITSMIETTTNTFNQDSQDTGYQTNSVINCGNGSTSSNSAQSSSNPSMMNMDTTNNIHNLTSNEIIAKVSVTPMNIELYLEEKENKAISQNIQESITAKKADLNSLKSDLKKFISGSSKRQLSTSYNKANGKSVNNKSLYSPSNSRSLKIKKNSISLNSLENILGTETPLEGTRLKKSPESLFKPINSNPKLNLLKIKKSPTAQDNVYPMKPKSNIETVKKIHLNLESTNLNDDYMNSSDVSMSTLNNSNAKATDLDECEQLIIKKHELDSLYIDQSLLMNKVAPSEYARNVILKAKTDLNLLGNYLSTNNELNNSPPRNLNSVNIKQK